MSNNDDEDIEDICTVSRNFVLVKRDRCYF